MSNWRTGYRFERMEYRLLGLDLSPMGLVEGIEACRLSGSVNADIRWGGSLTWSGTTQPDWSKYLVHPWYIVEGEADGTWPICPPMFVKVPTTKYTGAIPQTADLSLYDVTYQLAKRLKLTDYLAIGAGTNIADRLATRWAIAGVRYDIISSSQGLAAAMNWDPGESEMAVANQLLSALNYWSVSANNNGTLLGAPWVDPAQRMASWNFSRDEASIISAETEVTQDNFDIPNRMTGVPRVAAGVTPLPVTVTLDSVYPDSPYTFANRGYWVDAEVERDIDAADTTTLTSLLVRKLLDAATSSITRVVKHAWVPEVSLGSLVTYPVNGVLKRYTVQKMDIACEVGGLPVTAEWKEVA